MGKFDDTVELYAKEMKEKLGMKTVDVALLKGVAKACGPSLYNKDASKVAASDPKELERIKKNFLIKKLGLKDGPKLDEGMQAAINTIGKSNRNKYRAVVYYLLAKHFRKASMFK